MYKLASLLVTLLLVSSVDAFGIFNKASSSAKLPLPKFDEASQRWIKNPNDDGEYPYDAVGALLRHGPSPFITRLTNADEYEQGILKYMAVAKVSRAEATGTLEKAKTIR